jgi:AAA domain-containing protein
MSEQLDRALAGLDELGSQARKLELVPLDRFVVRPSVRWLIRDILQPQTIAVVFGPAKNGKTFAICDLLMHAAHGLAWHGHAVTRPLRVAFLAGEGRSGLRLRLHAWLAAHDTVPLRGDFRLLPESLSLPDRVSDVVELLKEYRPDATCVDTVNAYYGGGDENSTQDMTRFCDALRYVRDAAETAVVAVHHTGLADSSRERGSGVLRGAADVIVQVAKDEGGSGCIGFQVVAARDAEDWRTPLALRLQSVETDWLDEDGRVMTTCIVQPANAPVTLPGRGARKLNDAQRITIDVVQTMAKQRANGGGTVLLHRHEIVDEAIKRGVSRPTAYRHLHDLSDRMGWKLLDPGSLEVAP